ncbi:MAG: hypothetical protein GTN80_08210 [Nitrososphaeria archaeon]|nr:hypothetical protein [Nitrososphaeria archaeon]NIQ33606.1 hypothetical protein [Nitrososphaeria archaeon]
MTVLSYEIKDQQLDEDRDIATHITGLYRTSRDWRQDSEDHWDEHYKDYRFYRKKEEHVMRSNIYVPYIFAIVESVVPKLLNTIFSSSPIISVIAREGGDIDLAFLLERFLDYAFQEESLEFFASMEDFFKEACIYGTAFMKVLPRFLGTDVPEFDYIDADPVDIYKIFPDPRARSLKKADWIIHKDWIEYDRLLEMAKQGIYKKSTVQELKDKHESEWNVDKYKRERIESIERESEGGYNPMRKAVEILEYWDRDEIVSVAGREIILKREKNPFKGLLPFVMTRYTSVPHEFYGIGIPEMAQTLQQELNDLRNQRMDNVNIIINRMFIANKYSDIDFDTLVSYPGNVILAGDVDDVKPLDTRDVTRSCYMEEERLITDIQNVTGEWEYGRGQPPERRETATGIIRLQQAGNIRFDSIVKRIEFGTMRALAKMFIWYAYHFLPPERMMTIVGEEEFRKRKGMRFYEMSAHEILRQYHFQPLGSSVSAVKEMRAQQMLNLFNIFNQDPLIDQEELRRMVMISLDVKNIDKLLISEEEMMAEQQAAIDSGFVPPGAPGAAAAGAPPVPAATQAPPAEGGQMAVPVVPVQGAPVAAAPGITGLMGGTPTGAPPVAAAPAALPPELGG